MPTRMKRRAYFEFVGLTTVKINTLFIAQKRFELKAKHHEHYIDLITLKLSNRKMIVLDESSPRFFAYISFDDKYNRCYLRVFARTRIDHIEELGTVSNKTRLFDVILIEP